MCDCNKHCYTPSVVEGMGIYMYDFTPINAVDNVM